jgi:hypothetical protein
MSETQKRGLNGLTELEFFLNEKCREDPDLLATIISEYVWSLTPTKLAELEDFLVNNFGDN